MNSKERSRKHKQYEIEIVPRTQIIDDGKRLVIVRYSGVVSDEDLRTCVKELESAKFPPEYREFADLRQVTRFNATSSTLRTIAASSSFAAGSIRVILAPSDESYGIGRMVQIFAELSGSTPFQVVHSQDEAEEILKVQLD